MLNLKSTVAGAFAAMMLAVASTSAHAATLLDGVTLHDLSIGGAKYDVTFTGDAFDGTLTFNTRAQAVEALAAILASSEFQAFFPYESFAGVLVPHAFDGQCFYVELAGGWYAPGGYGVPNGFDWSDTGFTLATFAPTSAVPEPATWAMMIAGFGVVGVAVRRRRAAALAA